MHARKIQRLVKAAEAGSAVAEVGDHHIVAPQLLDSERHTGTDVQLPCNAAGGRDYVQLGIAHVRR